MSNTNNFISESEVQSLENEGKLAPVEAPPIVPGQPAGTPPGGGPPQQSSIDPYGGVPLPPNFGLQPDLTKTVTPSSTGPIRLMPLFGGPQENAKTISIVREAIAAIPPVVIPPSAVTLAAPTVLFNEDFFPLSLVTGSPANTVQLTKTGWVFWNTSFNNFNFIRGPLSHLGQVMWTNTASINNVGTMAPTISGSDTAGSANSYMGSFWPLLDTAPWTLTFIFKFDAWPFFASGADFSTNNACFYLGLTGDVNFAAQTRPRVGAWVRFDTDTTAPSIGDTTFVLEVVNNAQTSNSFGRNNTQGTTLNTGISAVPGTWHTLVISSATAGTISLSLDGGAALTVAFPATSLVLNAGGNTFTAGNTKNWELNWITGASAPIGALAHGSSFTVSGVTTVGYTVLNGTWTCSMASNNAHVWWYGTSDLANAGSLNNGITLVFNSALMPFMTAGNSGVAGPTAGVIGFFLDAAKLTTP